jgi:hypothetical protein
MNGKINMTYYPKSQIKPNLYTNGGEFILSSTKKDYKGYYYNISSGKSYSGKNPTDKPNILLILKTPLNTTKTDNDFNILTGLESPNLITTINYGDTSTYLNLSTNLITSERFIPLFNPTLPTSQEKQNGQYTRYFCKKTNELKYLEIDKETHTKLKSKDLQIAWDLYEPASLLWVIKGTQENVFNTNKAAVFKIEQNQRWNGFSQYFKENYSKYYESSTISNLYTAGGEFTTKNGQNYIGFYHIHNGTTPMVGKNHINEFHETLIPVVKPKPLTQTTSSVVITTTPTPPTTSGGGGSYGGGGGGGY